MPDKTAIAERFFALHPSWTQAELAKKYNVTQGAVSQWKNGLWPVPWEKLFQAAREFDVTLDWLLEGREPKYRQPPGDPNP